MQGFVNMSEIDALIQRCILCIEIVEKMPLFTCKNKDTIKYSKSSIIY